MSITLVLVVVMMPHERALELDELHLLPVQLGRDARLPVVGDRGELLGERHLVGHGGESG